MLWVGLAHVLGIIHYQLRSSNHRQHNRLRQRQAEIVLQVGC